MVLLVDDRWTGSHGIARFAGEVVPRMRVPHRALTGPVDPLSPLDVLNPGRLRLSGRDIVYSPGFNAGLSRARQVLTLHDLIHLDDPDERSTAKRLYYERLVRPAVRRAGLVITVSPTSARSIRTWIDRDDVRVVDVGNGCSDIFLEAAVTLPPDDATFAYVGNLKPHKNPRVVFAALAQVTGARLTVVSRDSQAVQELAAEFGVTDRVRAVSDCTDQELRDVYASSRALLMPSLSEGFGLPAVESIAVGRPVVHWAGCEAVAQVVGPHGAAVQDAHDPSAWADTMRAVIDDRTGHPLPDAAWRHRHSWDAVAGRVDAALTSF
ncbi:glycosyltransferase family 4 protein [Amnibacterium kyonggiense]|uniref:Glycosyltransferase involved in cell wall biosynthesis n=1 Tax=Amnibacterium kyonggiense TaxID=595671 RepID=A0A4V3EA65_9MICO|nr:glycosyltransferase family 1 protein [Amnibacterium kyonggiense]TDS74954.1 glycosyltransferase involved in cell wall biosynthesis [Amnibacterium kyonggiense]